MKVSVIIPVFNEEKVIENCLLSLSKQTINDLEIIVVDDGSSDKTRDQIKEREKEIRIQFLRQKHLGPGSARNLGVSKAKGEIIVFVDADMEFESDFVEKLIAPIVSGESIGTYSREEYLLNKNNTWAKCWNLNAGRGDEKMIGDNEYKSGSPVFRAILKKKFEEASGFDTKIGYTDDWSISRKLGTQATPAQGAKFYHRNPESLAEVWKQARWIGKNEFLTGSLIRRLYNLIRYNPIFSPLKGFYNAVKFNQFAFLIFSPVYDTALFISVLLSFGGEAKSK